jgi:transcriptional regulator
MLQTSHFTVDDVDEIKRLIRENPWATIVSNTAAGLVASHYPVLCEESAKDSISIVSHFGRPDEEIHELGQHEVLVIIQGAHGYISPGWYPAGQFAPTWNHVTAHLWGTPEILSEDETFSVLSELVDTFEGPMPHPTSLQTHPDAARSLARGTVGLRMRVTRFDARLKLSQNKEPDVVDRIVDELDHGEHYANRALAREMRRLHGARR